ncbi:hypothetical protein SP90_13855 [Halodesulfovibrio spirochaetisodalis]|uniref:Uncharacterized protein n=1 Tax=Halodesulfovibrio spirochaetisodalis TaxID=1560234 RepID=A0A1B7XA09_9BACT|nr:hypothetical protein SP90_13855 [Halodesulfovibrio spirochaetisodalis]
MQPVQQEQKLRRYFFVALTHKQQNPATGFENSTYALFHIINFNFKLSLLWVPITKNITRSASQ